MSLMSFLSESRNDKEVRRAKQLNFATLRESAQALPFSPPRVVGLVSVAVVLSASRSTVK